MSAIKRAVDEFESNKAFAEAIGVSPSFVSQWISGNRGVPPRLCRAIESATGGRVTAEELRPDVFCDPTAA